MFKDSICDTFYSSFVPEKGKYTLQNIKKIYEDNPDIHYTMITGGGPTFNPPLLCTLVDLAKSYSHFVTIETEGSTFVATKADFISLSPKLSNSRPRVGSYKTFDKDVIISPVQVRRHETLRKNYSAMLRMITMHPDYQLKPVISNITKDMKEVKELQEKLDVPNSKVWLMPEGITNDQLQILRPDLINYCVKRGYNYSDRLQIVAFGNRRGV
jgi:7-carboxy-7-deazaguanine synthase